MYIYMMDHLNQIPCQARISELTLGRAWKFKNLLSGKSRRWRDTILSSLTVEDQIMITITEYAVTHSIPGVDPERTRFSISSTRDLVEIRRGTEFIASYKKRKRPEEVCFTLGFKKRLEQFIHSFFIHSFNKNKQKKNSKGELEELFSSIDAVTTSSELIFQTNFLEFLRSVEREHIEALPDGLASMTLNILDSYRG